MERRIVRIRPFSTDFLLENEFSDTLITLFENTPLSHNEKYNIIGVRIVT